MLKFCMNSNSFKVLRVTCSYINNCLTLRNEIIRAVGGTKIFGVFHVKNHDFTPKNHIFSNCRGRRENCWGISCENHDFTPKHHIFPQF